MKTRLILFFSVLMMYGGETNIMAQEFSVRGIRGTAQVGAYAFELVSVTLEESDQGQAINLSMQLSDAQGETEKLYMSVPAMLRIGEVHCRFGVVALKRVDDLDSNFYRTPGNITWWFEFRPAEHEKTTDNRIPWSPQSRSLVLNSKVIFSFTCESLTPLFDIDDMPHGDNPWSLKGTIQKVYKGNLGKGEGEPFETGVTMYIGPVRSRPVGIWFGFDPFELPQPGESWVIFCSPKEEGMNPEDLLRGHGEGCTAYRSQDVKGDLDLTTQIVTGPLDLKPALKLAKEKSQTAGPVFLSFLWEYFGEAAVKDLDSFELFLSILESPALKSQARVTLIHELESFFSLKDGTPGLQNAGDRFIISLFRLLQQKEPENSDFQRNVLGTHIPNLLGIGSGLTKRSAAQVFAHFTKDRDAAISSLAASPHKKEAGILLQWIQKGSNG